MDISLIRALTFGIEGDYKFLDIPVRITNTNNVNKITRFVLGTLGLYTNIFVHEVGHELATKSIHGEYGEIEILCGLNGFASRPENSSVISIYGRPNEKEIFSILTGKTKGKIIFPKSGPLTIASRSEEILISFAGPLADCIYINFKLYILTKLITLIKNKRKIKQLNYKEMIFVIIANSQCLLSFGIIYLQIAMLFRDIITDCVHLRSNTGDWINIYNVGGMKAIAKSATIVWIFTASAIFLIYKQSYTSKEKTQPLYIRIYLYFCIKLSQTSVFMR